MTDIDDIINQIGRNYPKWLAEGMAKSPEVKNIETALVKMAKLQEKEIKNKTSTSKSANNLNSSFKDFDKTIGKVDKDFDEMTETTKDLSKAQKALKTSMTGIGSVLNSNITKSLAKGDLAGAAEDITSGLKGAAKSLTGFGGVAVGALGLLSEGITRAVEIIAKNNAAYGKLAQAGFRINDAFVGVSKAALSANMELGDFTELAAKNASVLAQWGPESARSLGELSFSIRRNNDFMGKFGLNMDEVNEYMSDYLEIQQRTGFLNKIYEKDYISATQQFIQDAAEFSNLIGYSRADILKTATRLVEDPSWGFFIRSLGDGGKAINDSYLKATTAISSIAGPELGGQIGSLMQDLVHYGGAVGDENRQFVGYLQSTNPQLLQLIQNNSDLIRSGKGQNISTEELTKQVSEAELQFNNANASILATNKVWAQFSDATNKSVAYNKNLNDKLVSLGLTYDQYEAQMKAIDDQNAVSAGTINMFHETLTAVEKILETGFISAIDANRGSLLEAATVLKDNALPAILGFTDYLKGFMDPGTREQMISNIEGAIADVVKGVFRHLLPSWLGGSSSSGGGTSRGSSGSYGGSSAGSGASSPAGIAKSSTPTGLGGLAAMGNAVKAGSTSSRESQYYPIIDAAAARYGVPASLLKAQMHAESRGNAAAISPKGAMGLFQFMPKTAAEFGVNPLDPTSSIYGAARKMSGLIKKYNGNQSMALAAYNEGEGNLAKGYMPAETKKYVNDIMSYQSSGAIQTSAAAPTAAIANNEAGVTATGTASTATSSQATDQSSDPNSNHLATLVKLTQEQNRLIRNNQFNNGSTI